MAMLEHAKRRREYVAQIRDSFEQGEAEPLEMETGWEVWGIRLRFVAALAIFLLFFYCLDTDTEIHGYTTEKIMDMIEDNRYGIMAMDILHVETEESAKEVQTVEDVGENFE